jgi:phosphoserine aminotransferase
LSESSTIEYTTTLNVIDKVAGQQVIAEKKAKIIYSALEAHPEVYKIVPDSSARSRMNICFRVTHVSKSKDYSAKATN